MHVTIARKTLLTICKRAARLATANATNKLLQGILLEADAQGQQFTVASTNLETTISSTVSTSVYRDGSCVLQASLALEIFNQLDCDEVMLALSPQHTLLVEGGSCQYILQTLDASSYPVVNLPQVATTMELEGLPSLIQKTSFAVSKDQTKGTLQCIALQFREHQVQAIASDGHRIVTTKGTVQHGTKANLLCHARGLSLLASLVQEKDVLSIGFSQSTVVFQKEGFTFATRLALGDYLNTQDILAQCQGQFRVLVDGKELVKTLDGFMTLATESATITLNFEDSTIDFTCDSSMGQANGSLSVITLQGIPTGTYHYPAKKLFQCAKALSDNIQLELCRGGFIQMTDDTSVSLLVPVRGPFAPKATAKKKSKKKMPDAA